MRLTFIACVLGLCTFNAWAQSVPNASDSRTVAWIAPQIAYSGYPKYRYQFQVSNSEPSINSIAEPGWYDSKIKQHTVAKVADPASGSKKALRHKLIKGMSYRTNDNPDTARASVLSSWNGAAVLRPSTPYWAAYAFYVDNDHPLNGSGGDLNILSLGHPVSSKNQQSMNALFLQRNGTIRFLISSNQVLDGTNSTYKGTSYTRSIKKGVWNYIIVQWKYEWDKAKGPYTRVWHAVGNGSPVQWVNTTIPNEFRESKGYHPWKFGEYMWDISAGWGASSSRTIYTKGLQILRDQGGSPTLNVNSMLALMRSM
jgi:hypothetical protein